MTVRLEWGIKTEYDNFVVCNNEDDAKQRAIRSGSKVVYRQIVNTKGDWRELQYYVKSPAKIKVEVGQKRVLRADGKNTFYTVNSVTEEDGYIHCSITTDDGRTMSWPAHNIEQDELVTEEPKYEWGIGYLGNAQSVYRCANESSARDSFAIKSAVDYRLMRRNLLFGKWEEVPIVVEPIDRKINVSVFSNKVNVSWNTFPTDWWPYAVHWRRLNSNARGADYSTVCSMVIDYLSAGEYQFTVVGKHEEIGNREWSPIITIVGKPKLKVGSIIRIKKTGIEEYVRSIGSETFGTYVMDSGHRLHYWGTDYEVLYEPKD